jgi:two-component system, OmpR family, phosphate regulon response regulator PhoB
MCVEEFDLANSRFDASIRSRSEVLPPQRLAPAQKAVVFFGLAEESTATPEFLEFLRTLFQFAVMSEKILIVEDELDVAELLAHHLRGEGFAVDIVSNGRAALAAVNNQPPALIVLDLMLPEISGLDLCRMIKSNPGTRNLPIVMLSARIEEIDRVLGFELGADDYVVKPFSPRELVLRIRAILRRLSQDKEKALLCVGDLVLDRSRHEVRAADRVIDCTATEFKLLAVLMERQGRVQDRDRLLSDVWGYDSVIDTRTVDTHMRRLRDKLGPHGSYIETIRGFGYRLAPQEGT